MTANALVLQCGGPTAVINASLSGVMRGCQSSSYVGRLWGARHGVGGLVRGEWVDLTGYAASTGEWFSRLEAQPGAALESGRDRLGDEQVAAALDRLAESGIGVVLIIGGNGSMVAAQKLIAAAAAHRAGGDSLQVIAIPKTIDNDIAVTDACPGYASAARFVAQSVRDVGLDLYSMREFDDVAVIEVMGRHTGWLAAASALARWDDAAPPHLILLPEVAFDESLFLAAVGRRYESERMCIVVAAEGIRDEQGVFLAEKYGAAERDGSGQKLFGLAGGPSPYLARLVSERLGLRCRQMRPDLIQRSSSATASSIDRALAKLVGEDAVKLAAEGRSGVMVGLERGEGGWKSVAVPLDQVVGRERVLPSDYILPGAFDVTQAFISYARPLIGEWSAGAIRLL